MKTTPLYSLALVFLIVGGLNWGLIGLFNFNLVAGIFGDMSLLSRLIYIIVGVSAAYVASVVFKKSKT